MSQKLQKLWNENKRLIYVSIAFGTLLMFAVMANDDITVMHIENGTLYDYWMRSVEVCSIWSSRVFVNFVVFIFTDCHIIYWGIFMAISMYALLYSLKVLFIKNPNDSLCEIFMICMVLLFPYWHLSSAGWIATMTTYFSPIAFGFFSLIPIKKVYLKQNIRWYEYIIYVVTLIYAANNEQVMIVLFFCYLLAGVLFWKENKKISLYLFFNELIVIGNMIFFILCPGNAVRREKEIVRWFPAFEHMSIVDQIELGYETVAHWLVFENNLFFEVTCILLAYFVMKKYEDTFLRLLAVFPVLITVGLGPLKTILVSLYPGLSELVEPIPYWGLITPQSRGGLGPAVQFFVFSICLVLVLIEIMLLCNKWTECIVCMTLLISGFASRVAMGLSPTIYASSIRTNAVMCMCIIATTVYIFSVYFNSEQDLKIMKFRKETIVYGMEVLAIFAVLNLTSVIYNTFR